jgi:hypothetical protein
MTNNIRTSLISESKDPKKCPILEIGALDAPTFTKPHFPVKYADFASRKELAEKGKGNPRYDYKRLVDVDFIVSGQPYGQVIKERFGIIVANHVIEHIPDTIRWLDDLGSLLSPDGILFLSVPDRRYTFDITRRETNIIDLIRAYRANKCKPDFEDILEHFWYHKNVNAQSVWHNTHHEMLKRRRFTPPEALRAAKTFAALPYADVHCHVFTQNSFENLLTELRDFELLRFQEFSMHSIRYEANEFNVALSKPLSISPKGLPLLA